MPTFCIMLYQGPHTEHGRGPGLGRFSCMCWVSILCTCFSYYMAIETNEGDLSAQNQDCWLSRYRNLPIVTSPFSVFYAHGSWYMYKAKCKHLYILYASGESDQWMATMKSNALVHKAYVIRSGLDPSIDSVDPSHRAGSISPCWIHLTVLDPSHCAGSISPCWIHLTVRPKFGVSVMIGSQSYSLS